MSEYDDDSEVQGTEEPEAPQASSDLKALQKKVATLEKENHGYRAKIRRADLGTKFGQEIAELVPDELDPERWEEFAEKLQGLRGTSVAGETAEAPEEPEEITPAEQALAAANASPVTGAAPPTSDMSAKDVLELGKSDPARAAAIIQSGQFRNP